jgi:hypothetical protein
MKRPVGIKSEQGSSVTYLVWHRAVSAIKSDM